MLGGRAVVNSVNYEDGDGPDSRMRAHHAAHARARCRRRRADHRRAGPGPHRGVEGRDRRAADRRPHGHVGGCRSRTSSSTASPSRSRPGRRRRAATRWRRSRRSARSSAAIPTSRRPSASRTSPSGSTRPPASCSTRCSWPSASRPGWTRRSCTRRRSCRWRGSPTSSARSPSTWSTTGAVPRRRAAYDPLQRFLELFEGVDGAALRPATAEELAALPLSERLERRIVDGERTGLEADLDEALPTRPALEIVNDTLLAGMKTVGDLFGSGRDAAAVRAAVGRGDEGRGRLPRAAHGAQSDDARARAPSCSRRSRATSTTSARTSSTSS